MRYVFILMLLLSVIDIHAQGGSWVWVNGTQETSSLGSTDTVHAPSDSIFPPGLNGALKWIDKQGNFWVYGGFRPLGVNDALWKYDPHVNHWTWINRSRGNNQGEPTWGIRGIPSVNNSPGERTGSATWTDSSGYLWLFGGTGTDTTGSGGGLGDLWRYNTGTNEWTWINGLTVGVTGGVYGTLYVPAAGNIPGSRFGLSEQWVDSANNLWLFGGGTDYPDPSAWNYNDVWMYNISTNQWTWMGGEQGVNNSFGYYGALGVEASFNSPPHRGAYASWMDAKNLYIYGGTDADFSVYDDVWKYSLTTHYWTWIARATRI